MLSLKKIPSALRAKLRAVKKSAAKFFSMKIFYPAWYRLHSLRPVDERLVVFIEVRMRSVSDNYALLYDRLKCLYDFDLRVHFLEELLVPMRTTFRRSRKALSDIARAKYVFINDATNMTNAVRLRKETKLIQTWHACGPFKMFGYSVADLRFGATRRQMERYPIHRGYTHLILGGEASVEPYAEAMGMQDRLDCIYPIGVSRTDVFFDPAFIEAAREKLLRLMPSAAGKSVILYAPTFRGHVNTASTPNVLRPEMLMDALGDAYVLVENHHPFVKKRPAIPERCEAFCQDMTGRMSIEELLCVTDICVTDYSSLVFEFSLFRRPMIFFAHDLDDYYDWRGFYYRYEDFVCGPIVTTNLELIREIENIGAYDLSRVDAFRERFMTGCDGHATERILDTVFGADVLAAHRRAVPLEGAFHTLPAAPRRGEEGAALRLRALFFSRLVPFVYRRAAKKPVGERAVFLQYRGEQEREDLAAVRAALGAELPAMECETVFLRRDREKGLPYLRRCLAAVRRIACARVLVTAEDSPLSAVLPRRDETAHLRLPSSVWPLRPFGRASLAFRAGEALPFDFQTYENVTLGPAPCTALEPLFSSAYGREAPALGAPVFDMLRDGARRASAREELSALFPESAGKRVLLYAPSARRKKGKPSAPAMPDTQLLYEYLGADWVLVTHYPARTRGRKKPPVHLVRFWQDLSGRMPLIRLLAAADVCVTDFREEAFAFRASGRPLLAFARDFAAAIPARNYRPGWDAVFSRPFTADTAALIASVGETADTSDGGAFFDCTDCARAVAHALAETLRTPGGAE